MPEYLHPGVYVEEVELGPKSIEGVSTSTVGFVGKTERGTINPTLITGFPEYAELYGGYLTDSFMSHAVYGFFKNGGKRCIIGRILGKNATLASTNIPSHRTNIMSIVAKGHGKWGNNIYVKISKASLDSRDSSLFKISIKYFTDAPSSINDNSKAALDEIHDNLSINPKSSDYYAKTVSNTSQLVYISPQKNTRPGDSDWVQLENGTDNGTVSAGKSVPNEKPIVKGGSDDDKTKPPKPEKPKVETHTAESDWTPSTKDYDGYQYEINDPNTGELSDILHSGLLGLEENSDISIITAPDENSVAGLRGSLVAHCEKMRDRFAILQVNRQDSTNITSLFPDVDSKYAGIYMPWINAQDPITNSIKLCPPCGHIAGIYARSDVTRGVHKAPANEKVSDALSLQIQISKEQQDILNPRGLNVIRSFPGRGPIVWGARTTSIDPDWKYVNVRRLFLYLEKSIERSTQWVVFEPNNEKLWLRLKATIRGFLTEVWKSGALMGTNPDEAFFVKCDRTTMTQNDIDNGRLIVEIGVAPTKPAEFVIFRMAQTKGGSLTAQE